MEFTRLKMELLTPIPRARDSTAKAVMPGLRAI